MRFGVCAGPESAGILKAAGYDYIELAVNGHLAPLRPEEEVMPQLLAALESSKLQSEAFNSMLPGELKVVGPDTVIDLAQQKAYLAAAFSRAARAGGKIVVFGSGGARRVPDGFSRSRAEDQIVEFLKRAGDEAGKYAITIAIEPLNVTECNILNSVAEAMETVSRVGHPHVQVLSDLYHVAHDGQSYSETATAGAALSHVHVAGPRDRKAPQPGDEAYLTEYFQAVRATGYNFRVSIEAGWNDIATDAAAGLATLRAAWESSGKQA